MNGEEKVLDVEELNQKVFERLIPLDEMSFFERYAMFMGKAQIFEMGLKRLLFHRYSCEESKLEKMTLGQAVNLLEEHGLRQDFINIAKELVDYRNSLAHDFLQIDALGKSLIGPEFQALSEKQLRHALFSVEYVIQVYDFLDENDYWASVKKPE